MMSRVVFRVPDGTCLVSAFQDSHAGTCSPAYTALAKTYLPPKDKKVDWNFQRIKMGDKQYRQHLSYRPDF